MACKIGKAGIYLYVGFPPPQWGAKSFYQIRNGVHDQKEVKKHSTCAEFRDEIIWPWQRGGGYGSGEYEWNSPPKANGAFCIIFSPLGEESVLPLLTQESTSKARRGILRRAVFSEDQRKALEKMFQKQKYISKTDRKKLAINLGLKESQVLMSRKMCDQHTAPDF